MVRTKMVQSRKSAPIVETIKENSPCLRWSDGVDEDIRYDIYISVRGLPSHVVLAAVL